MLKTQLENKYLLEEQIIRCLTHLDPKDLPKIRSIFESLKKKLRCDKYTRYQIEYSLLKFEKEVSNLVDLNSK
jgi:hypothetical protein